MLMAGDGIDELLKVRRYSAANAVNGSLAFRTLIRDTLRGISTRRIFGSCKATVEDWRQRGRLLLERGQHFFRGARSVDVAEGTSG